MVDCNRTSSGECSEAEGQNTVASGKASHAEGDRTLASKTASHAEGRLTTASGFNAHAEGNRTVASGRKSHAEGDRTKALEYASHAEGQLTTASGFNAHAEGNQTTASGRKAHAEGADTTASGLASHAEGFQTIASGDYSHAEGNGNMASGEAAHAEGEFNMASGKNSYAKGIGNIASGPLSHAEGYYTRALAAHAHAFGIRTTAADANSFVYGRRTTSNGKIGVHVLGVNGGPAESDLDHSCYLVNSDQGVVAKVLFNGNAQVDGTVTASNFNSQQSSGYAEMFEASNGETIEAGHFVTFDVATKKIRKARSDDNYILGVTSLNPVILANTEDPDRTKFLLDEWNQPFYQEVTIPAEKDDEGNVLIEEFTQTVKKLNPKWDPDHPGSSRLEKPEWVAVGLIGTLLVRDDGTCQPGGFARPNDEGIATDAEYGYRVVERTGANQISVMVAPIQMNTSHAEQIGQLIKFKEQGYLTEKEFEIEKQKIIRS